VRGAPTSGRRGRGDKLDLAVTPAGKRAHAKITWSAIITP